MKLAASVIIALLAASPLYAAENVKKCVRDSMQGRIQPWNPNHSKGLSNLDKRFGDPKWDIQVKDDICKIVLTFPKGPFDSDEAADFQMKSINDILKKCSVPPNIDLILYSKDGKKMEGIATARQDDSKIRWRVK